MTDPNQIIIEDKLLVLDIGGGKGTGSIPHTFPNSTVHILDVDKKLKPDVLHDIRKPTPKAHHNKYDIVVMSHVLEHIEINKIIPVLLNVKKFLKVGGELWIMVPALEWAANEILKDQPSPVLQGFLYGSQTNEWQLHKSGYTLVSLRYIFNHIGIVTRQAFRNAFEISLDDKKYTALQNIIIGLKVEDKKNGQQSIN